MRRASDKSRATSPGTDCTASQPIVFRNPAPRKLAVASPLPPIVAQNVNITDAFRAHPLSGLRPTIPLEANSASHGDSMARRRYQRGSLRLRGKNEKVWVAKWREDIRLADGSVRRVQKGEVLGSLKEYKTRR